MVGAEGAPAAGEGVGVEGACLFVLAECAQVDGEVVGRVQGDCVVRAEGAAVAGEGVGVEGAGLLVLTQLI